MEIYDISFLGYSYDSDCIYINGTGVDEYEFFIQLNRCGTLGGSDHNKKRDANVKNTDPTVKNTCDVILKIDPTLNKKYTLRQSETFSYPTVKKYTWRHF